MGTGPGVTGAILKGVLERNVSSGELVVGWPDGSNYTVRGADNGGDARVDIREKSALGRIIRGGAVGFAEGYMAGEWDTPDLAELLDFGLANINGTENRAIPALRKPFDKALHALRSNGPRRAKRNIAYHYDLGNDFYQLWLDETMTYSSALFCGPDAERDLCAAQRTKWDRMLDLLQPGAKDHLLEIGCGWGGFALHAARQAGCKITGITLSQEQHDFARRRVAEEGLEGLVDIRIQDYRDVAQTYSGVASIEMFEAVGERYWPVFFGKVADLLESGKRAAIQTITIDEASFLNYRDNPDFIQRYIFPGGMLPTPERFRESASDNGLQVGEAQFFGDSYAATLEVWLERFDQVRDQVMALGFDERFIRMWRYYLAYCRAGFRSGNIDVMQVSLER